MSILKSHLIKSDEYRTNYAYNETLCKDLSEKRAEIAKGGDERSRKRHLDQGKMLVRERIAALCDPGAPFLEIGQFAAFETYEDRVPAAGLIAGVGIVHGRSCMIIANDATVKGGTYYPITVKKHLRAQEIAQENALPCLYLVDSGGAFLPLQAEVFADKEHFGRIFYNQANMSAARIPQIAAVMGMCTAGGAYVPAMSDQTIIVNGTGCIFLAGPPLVKAATGEDVTNEELGGARVHTEMSGVADYLAENDAHAIEILREIVLNLGSRTTAKLDLRASIQPSFDPDEILGIWPSNQRKQVEIKEIITRIVDESRFLEFKRDYATTLVCGFAHIHGIPCGIIANNGVIFGESALKGAHFIELCSTEKIPILFLQNVTGFMVGARYERAGIAREGAKMVHAVATAKVPKITVLAGGSFGAGNYGMCGRAFAPRFLWSWPTSRISVMGGEQAAQVMVTVKRMQLEREERILTQEEESRIADPIRAKYEREGHPYFASARLWDDGIVDPRKTRDIVGLSLAAALNTTIPDTRVGVFRM